MAKRAIGTISAAAALLTMALTAEAQDPKNTPLAPLSVSSGAVESTYESVVNSSGSFYVRLRVWHLGVIKHNTTTFVSNYGTVNFSKLVTGMNLWGLQAGQTLNYWTKVWLASDTSKSDTDDWYVPVIQTFNTRRLERLLDRFRREELCA